LLWRSDSARAGQDLFALLGGVDEGRQHALRHAGVIVDRRIDVVEAAGFDVAAAVDVQYQARAFGRRAAFDAGDDALDVRHQRAPGRARVNAERLRMAVPDQRQAGIVEELGAIGAPGQHHRQRGIEQRPHRQFQAQRPLRHGADPGRVPRMGPHLQFHGAHGPRQCGRGRSGIKRPGHVVPFKV